VHPYARFIAAALLAGVALSTGDGLMPAQGQTVADFYKGKTITLQIGYPPGGGYDIYARHLARFYGQHIPGQPAIITQNVPGAGSLKLTNAIYNTAPRDGTVLGAIGREHVLSPLFGLAGVQFDATKMNWIGNLDSAASLCVAWHTTAIHKIEDLRDHELAVGGTGPGSATVVMPTILKQVLGYQFKVVSGYPGGNDITLALERGEVQGRCAWSYASLKSTQASYLTEKKIRPLAVSTLKRIPDLPDVPTVVELAKTDSDRQLLELVLTSQLMARPIIAPPGLPADRLAALRDGFSATVRDPEFLAEAQKLKLELSPMDADEIIDLVQRIYATPKPVVQAAIEAMQRAEH
jgi:tripartite-type tricarboxylate transporter receptor subunit TctC